jgi:hypothetical protein
MRMECAQRWPCGAVWGFWGGDEGKSLIGLSNEQMTLSPHQGIVIAEHVTTSAFGDADLAERAGAGRAYPKTGYPDVVLLPDREETERGELKFSVVPS